MRDTCARVSILYACAHAVSFLDHGHWSGNEIIVQWYTGVEGERRERGSYLQMFVWDTFGMVYGGRVGERRERVV